MLRICIVCKGYRVYIAMPVIMNSKNIVDVMKDMNVAVVQDVSVTAAAAGSSDGIKATDSCHGIEDEYYHEEFVAPTKSCCTIS